MSDSYSSSYTYVKPERNCPYNGDDDDTVLSWPMAEQFTSRLVTQEALAKLRAKYSIPEHWGLHTTVRPACSPPAAGGNTMCVMYAHAFEAGMRVPLHPFFSDVLAHFGIAPSQLAPNGWRLMAGFVVLCHFRGIGGAPSLPVFRHLFSLSPLPRGKGWYCFRVNKEGAGVLFTGLPSSIKGWKDEFFLVSSPGAPWRCPVRWGCPTKQAMSEPVLTEKEAAVARKLLQGQGMFDLKTYLCESNLVAAKISRAATCHGIDASLRSPASSSGKKRKAAAASGDSDNMLRSELEAKERDLAKARGEISRLREELGNAKTRELAEARQSLAYERKLGAPILTTPEDDSTVAEARKRRHGIW